MKSISDVRRARLAELIEKHAEGNAAAFARLIDRSRAQVGFWTSAPDKPGARHISNATARMLEDRFGEKPNWMDTDPEAAPQQASQPVRLDPAIMATAEGMVRVVEARQGEPMSQDERGEALATVYSALADGRSFTLLEQLLQSASERGDKRGKHRGKGG